MHRRTACIDSPVQLSGADSPSSLSQAGSGLLPASHAVQGTPHEMGFPMRKVPAGPNAPPELGPQTQRMQHPAVQSGTPATYRPRTIAQKAGMNAWSRHGLRYGCIPVSCTWPPYLSAPLRHPCAILQGMTWHLWCRDFHDWGVYNKTLLTA